MIRSTFSRSHLNQHQFVERIEHWRNGVQINTSLNPTFNNSITGKTELYYGSRFNGNRHDTLITMKHDVSNLDIRNGDELRFVYGYAYGSPAWRSGHVSFGGTAADALKAFQHYNLALVVDDVLNKHELISR